MTTDQIIELAIQGHASKRDAIKWAIEQERGQCAKVCEDRERANLYGVKECAAAIRARGEQCG
jgi:hypothetical protein